MFLLIGGCIGGCASCSMDTTVEGVHNIGKISERQTSLIGSGVCAVVGMLMVGFGELIAARTHKGPRCPECNGPLDDQPKVCRHCRIELRWTKNGSPLTVERFEAYRQALEDAAVESALTKSRRAQIAAQRREELGVAGHAIGDAALAFLKATAAFLLSVPLAVDATLKKAAGDGNEIIYRFLQAMVYVGVPAGIAAAVLLIR
jgi:hypothetical protein